MFSICKILVGYIYFDAPYLSSILLSVAITLEAQLPPAYPNEAPTLEVVGVKGLSTDQVATLQGMADAAAAENLGMAMCYTVAEELREWLVAHNEKPQVF